MKKCPLLSAASLSTAIVATFFLCLFGVLPSKADVELRLMTWVGYSPDAEVAQFEKAMTEKYKQSVSVKIHYINDYDEAFTLLRKGEADVIVLVSHILNDARFQFIKNELIAPMDRKRVPNYEKIMGAYKDHCEDGGKLYAVPIASGPYGLAYNKKYVNEPPKSWNVLWDPKYKGKYAITNGIFEVNLYVTALAMGYPKDSFGDFVKLNNSEFRGRLRSLIENAESFWPGIDEAHHLQGLHLATSWGFSMPGLKELGEDWAMAEPEEGSPAWIDVHTIRKTMESDPFKMKLAHDWINFTLTPDYQLKVIVEGIATPPVTTDAAARLSQEQRKAFNLDDPEFNKNFRAYYPTITSERTRNGLKLIWKQANKGVDKPVRQKPE